MHVAPGTHLFRTFYIIVGYVHATCVGNTPVDDHYFAVVAGPDVVDPGAADGVELIDVDTVVAQGLEVVFLQGLVVGVVAEAVEECAYLDPFTVLLTEDVEEERGDAVVAEVEVFQVYALLGLTDVGEEVVELFLSAHQQLYLIVGSEANAVVLHLLKEDGFAVGL